jgi:hypothetical protein
MTIALGMRRSSASRDTTANTSAADAFPSRIITEGYPPVVVDSKLRVTEAIA